MSGLTKLHTFPYHRFSVTEILIYFLPCQKWSPQLELEKLEKSSDRWAAVSQALKKEMIA